MWIRHNMVSDRQEVKGSEMALYEHIFLARQDLSQSQVDALAATATEIVEANEGKVTKTETWGLKSLAYKIKKNRKAHYTCLNIDAPHDAVAEMERRMGLSTDVLRFMTIRVDEHETEPSIQMKKGGDRDDRRGGDRGGFRGGDRGGRGGPPRGDGGPRGGEGSTFRARPPRDDSNASGGAQ